MVTIVVWAILLVLVLLTMVAAVWIHEAGHKRAAQWLGLVGEYGRFPDEQSMKDLPEDAAGRFIKSPCVYYYRNAEAKANGLRWYNKDMPPLQSLVLSAAGPAFNIVGGVLFSLLAGVLHLAEINTTGWLEAVLYILLAITWLLVAWNLGLGFGNLMYPTEASDGGRIRLAFKAHRGGFSTLEPVQTPEADSGSESHQ